MGGRRRVVELESADTQTLLSLLKSHTIFLVSIAAVRTRGERQMAHTHTKKDRKESVV